MKFPGAIFVLGIFPLAIATSSSSIQLQLPALKPRVDFPNDKSFPNCGIINSSLARSVNKDEGVTFDITDAVKGRHSWEAFVFKKISFTSYTMCQGTLISERAVLTSARCLFHDDALLTVDRYFVGFGVHVSGPSNEETHHQSSTVSNIIPHPNFNINDGYDYNLGIIILEKSKIKINEYVRPACLWNEDFDLERIASKTGEMTGWFMQFLYTYIPEGVLQTNRLRAILHETCYNEYKSFMEKYLRPNRNFCVKYANGQSSCTLGTGSGFILEKEDTYFLRGIATHGVPKEMKMSGKNISCTEHSFYLLTDLGYHMDWIVENVPDISWA